MRRGFTLVEVLLAMVVAVTVLTVVAQAMSVAHRGVVIAERQATAVMLATRKFAELENGELSMTMSQNEGAFEEDAAYSWRVDSQQEGSQELYEVTVRVIWTETGQELARAVRLMRKKA